MRRRRISVLTSIWLVAQLGDYGTSDHCWILRGMRIRETTAMKRHWISQEPALNGFLQRVEVLKESDLNAAAQMLGLPDAARCDGYHSTLAGK